MITLLRFAGAAGLALLVTGAACLGPLARPALAQARNVPNALQGFAANRDEPIRINANSLEVRDQQKQAVFTGNVVVIQGDTTLRCKELVVYYDGKESGGKAGAPASSEALASGSPINSSAIRRLEINGSVVVTTKEQTATGDYGTFETASNTITLNGSPVVLTSGPNVIRGKKLTVDLASGMSRFDGGRIESLIVPNSMKDGALPGGPGAKPGAGAKPAAKPGAKPTQ
ncbi:OstA family protein [Ancylobacter novellus DSM 506]|uniref:OstA family protein n=1 Tax=Ancylobacter novellus (strain ATCC 8093 / DSM 506 / JCM 20403 / CCM 1077 / IAM 12100 / NBRC 12443 / NCIMB 10456) TaxID=639283 RepID=D7A2W5_ANCN5|nr:LptA/OstA family protein [Ancylobacter novellus]ADH87683.1 OstA family protein [Ancylobacter novellus DSM 506]